MTSKDKKDAELTPEELEEQDGQPLPERTQMSLIHGPTGPPAIGPIFDQPIQPPEEV